MVKPLTPNGEVKDIKARFIRRTLHEPNLIPIKVDPNN